MAISQKSRDLVRRCAASAFVMGRASDNQTRVFWFSEDKPEAQLAALVRDGFSLAGLLGFDGVGLHLEPEEGPEALRLLKLAAGDFMLAALAMRPGAPSN